MTEATALARWRPASTHPINGKQVSRVTAAPALFVLLAVALLSLVLGDAGSHVREMHVRSRGSVPTARYNLIATGGNQARSSPGRVSAS